jgi:N-acetylneuraminic acid mutarotase
MLAMLNPRPTRTRQVPLAVAAVILLIGAALSTTWRQTARSGTPISPAKLSSSRPLPLSFEPNVGQTDPSVRFTAHANGGTLFFAKSEVVLSLAAPGAPEIGAKSKVMPDSSRPPLAGRDKESSPSSVLRVQFIGANLTLSVEQGNTLPGKVNYFLGKDPASWHTDLPTYGDITYSALYPGVKLVYEGTDGQLKGTYTLAAGTDPALIRWRYAGAERVAIDDAGNLQISLASATEVTEPAITVTEHAPQAWQVINGERVPVSSRYMLGGGGTIGFALGDYDHFQPLTIDPTITYATYLGGFFSDYSTGIALDGEGNIYVGGTTQSSDFPLAGTAFQTVYGGGDYDMFASKLSADGSTLIYSTFIGGSDWDVGGFVAVDSQGRVTIGGYTTSPNYPTTPGAYQTQFEPNYDVTVTKLSANGSSLVFSSLWGDGVLEPYGFAVDAAGNTYFTGYAFWRPDSIAFVSGLTADGSDQLFYRELGGHINGLGDENANTQGQGIAVDAAGNIYVTGETRAADFPTTPGAYRTFLQQYEDGFVTKFSPLGASMLYSTFIPGGGSDYPYDIDVDSDGNVYLTGWTGSADYPTTPGAFQTVRGDPTISFVTKLNPTLSALVYSTYLGSPQYLGSTQTIGYAIQVNSAGNAYVVGYTSSSGFPVANPIQGQGTLHGTTDGFITKFNPTGSGLVYSTFLGGTSGDSVLSIALDGLGNLYLSGATGSTDYPVVNPVQSTNHGSSDAIIAVISEEGAATRTPMPTATGTPPTATATPNPCGGIAPWHTEPPMTLARDKAIGAVAGDKFYVIGGSQSGREPPYVEVVERFDPATTAWSTVAPIPIAAEGMAAASIGNKIYVAGGWTVRNGFTLNLMQIYDVTTNSWSQGSNLPTAIRDAAASAYNGKVYIFGGSSTTSVYEYDPVANTYATKAPMPSTESQIAAATVGNRIYVVGGYRHDQYTHYAYDPVANTWSTIATPLTPSFAWPGAFALNGELWVVGGFDNFTLQGYPPSQEVHIYNPTTNSWRFGPAFNAPRSRSRAAGAVNGRGYVAGGVTLADEHVLMTSLESITYASCASPTATVATTATVIATGQATSLPATGTHTATPGTAIASSTSTALTTVQPTTSSTTMPITPTITACAITFSDVQEGSTFYPFVRCLACRGILGGYDDGTFRPNNEVTRGQLSKIVANAAGFSEPVSGQTFEDVLPTDTFYLFVERMVGRGIVGGYPCGGEGEPCGTDNLPYFRPNSNATRGQISKIVAISAGMVDPIGAQKFEDVLPGSTFYDYVQRLAGRGVISGYPCGGGGEPCGPENRPYFRPNSNATRGQTAKIVSNTFFPACNTP